MRISVITINYNTDTGFARTRNSVLAQDYPHLEWVVIDALSNDRSANDIESSVSSISCLIREKDQGIADAFNKGVDVATGEALVFMNAGDTFDGPTSLSQMVQNWDRARFGWIACGGRFMTEAEEQVYLRDVSGFAPMALVARGCRIIHASVMIETTLIRSFSGYDLAYRSAMDFDLWVRLISRQFLPQQSSLIASRFYLGGTSTSYSGFGEELRSLEHNGLLTPQAKMWMTARKQAVSRLQGLKRFGLVYKLKERLVK